MIKPSWQKLTWRRMNSALPECYSRKNRQQELMGFSERRGGERNKYLNTHYVQRLGAKHFIYIFWFVSSKAFEVLVTFF